MAETCPSLRTKNVTPHTLRHSFAMNLLRHGVDPATIALILGHEDVRTTDGVYLHADLTLKERAIARTAPLDSARRRYRPTDRLLAYLERCEYAVTTTPITTNRTPPWPDAAYSRPPHKRSNGTGSSGATPRGVSIGTDAASARRIRGPRCSRTHLATVGYEPLKPSAEMISNNDVANNNGFPTSNADNRSAHTEWITRSCSATVRAGGEPPLRHHLAIVAG